MLNSDLSPKFSLTQHFHLDLTSPQEKTERNFPHQPSSFSLLPSPPTKPPNSAAWPPRLTLPLLHHLPPHPLVTYFHSSYFFLKISGNCQLFSIPQPLQESGSPPPTNMTEEASSHLTCLQLCLSTHINIFMPINTYCCFFRIDSLEQALCPAPILGLSQYMQCHEAVLCKVLSNRGMTIK